LAVVVLFDCQVGQQVKAEQHDLMHDMQKHLIVFEQPVTDPVCVHANAHTGYCTLFCNTSTISMLVQPRMQTPVATGHLQECTLLCAQAVLAAAESRAFF